MKRILLIGCALVLLAGTGCRKCYYCEAVDNATRDVVHSETVCGEKLSDDYLSIWTDDETTAVCVAE